MLGTFKKSAEYLRALDQVKDWTRRRFSLSDSAAILVAEVTGTYPGCVPLETVVSHFEHIINLVGDEHVSFGTDFDGADMPDCVKDAAGLPVVLREFKRRGWSDDRLERVCNGNVLRVAEAVWR